MKPADNGRPVDLQARNTPNMALTCDCFTAADSADAPPNTSRHSGNDTISS
jgi:hypothetical protein